MKKKPNIHLFLKKKMYNAICAAITKNFQMLKIHWCSYKAPN